MNRTPVLSTLLAATMCAATTHAADLRSLGPTTSHHQAGTSFYPTIDDDRRIHFESEAQFQRDYGAHSEWMAPGVYLMIAGPFAGQAVSIGIDGLRHDLAALQRQLQAADLPATERKRMDARVAELQALARAHESRQIPEGSAAKLQFGQGFVCWSFDPFRNRDVSYSGTAEIYIDGGLYLDNDGGGLNPYYARMHAVAYVQAFPPGGFWINAWFNATASVTNVNTGQTVYGNPGFPLNGALSATNWVYFGPSFSHHLTASATASASGDCWVYLSLSDSFVF